MEQMIEKQDKILFIHTNEITLLDIPRVLDELGYDVYEANFGLVALEYEVKKRGEIVTAIEEFQIDYVITYDFIITVSEACMHAGVPYISWVYDAPQKELYMHYAQYPCNYVFAFDKMQVQRLRDIGLKNVVHTPLTVHVEKIRMVADTIGKKMKGGYDSDITFIGQLYSRENEDAVWERFDEEIKKELHHNIDTYFLKWDKETPFHGCMSDKCAAFFGNWDNHAVERMVPYISNQFHYEAAFLSRTIANRERIHVLNKLAEKYQVTFYTKEKDLSKLSDKITIKPGVSFDILTHIYRKSKINLNITLHCIETGASQRILDVMAAGGFMLSNYQEELEEMFVPGEEIVLYHNEQELEELVAYYLTHDEERERIARKGQEKVLREYDMRLWIEKMLQYVKKAELGREKSYIAMEAEMLRAQADLLLGQKTQAAYMELYKTFFDDRYNVTIRKNAELTILQMMLNCWIKETDDGNPCIFDNVDGIWQAKQKYLQLVHGLWRIEQDLSHDKCIEVVEYIRQNSISMIFIVLTIYNDLRDQEETMIKLSKLMAETNIAEAVRLLSYGLLILEGNENLLIQQANFLMDLQLWEQALKTLQKIENPTEELKEAIFTLSNALLGTNG